MPKRTVRPGDTPPFFLKNTRQAPLEIAFGPSLAFAFLKTEGFSHDTGPNSHISLFSHVLNWIFLEEFPQSQGITPALFVASSQSGLLLLTKKAWPEIAFVISQKQGSQPDQIAFAYARNKKHRCFLLTDSPCSRVHVLEQGESLTKKLAPRNVPPFVLKNHGLYGPKVTFYFLKMWKLAARGPIRARTIESLHSATEISSIDSLRACPL